MGMFESYILIGGRSSRLGQDKAFVDLNGRTLLHRAVDAVRRGLGSSRITAVAANEPRFAIAAVAADVPFIFDLHENRGPLGGLHAALADAKTVWLFVLACDYPFVSAQFIQLLADHVDEAFGVVVPEQQDGRLQPLCAFYRVETARELVTEIIERPRVPPPMHEIALELSPRIVRCEEYAHLDGAERFFVNINTPDELDRARQI